MLRRFVFLLILAVFLPASLSFAAGPRHHFENRKYERPPRYDPRLKYLQTRKAGNCMYGPGICTMPPKDNEIPYTRYKNSAQEKEDERRRRLRPWL